MTDLEEFKLLLQLVVFVRECQHIKVVGDDPVPIVNTAWCVACGSARIDGQWMTPGWFCAFDRQMERWNRAMQQGPVS